MDGLILRTYIENQKRPKLHIAKELGMSKQNLYQLFESEKFEQGTIDNIESVFKTKWDAIRKSVNIDSNIATPEKKVSNGQEISFNGQLLATIDKLAEANRILAEKVTTIPVSDPSDTQRAVESMLQGLREFVLKASLVGAVRYKSLEEARSAYRKEVGDFSPKKKVRDTQNG